MSKCDKNIAVHNNLLFYIEGNEEYCAPLCRHAIPSHPVTQLFNPQDNYRGHMHCNQHQQYEQTMSNISV